MCAWFHCYRPIGSRKLKNEDRSLIQLRVSFNDIKVTGIRLDGHLLKETVSDGYQIRTNPGTIVEIATSSDKVVDFYIAKLLVYISN